MRLSRALQPQDKKKKLIHLDGIHKKYIMRVNNLIVISIIQV